MKNMTQRSDALLLYVNSDYLRESVHNYLEAHDMYAKDFASRVGISPSTLCRLQNNYGGCRINTLNKIATILKMNPAKLIISRETRAESPDLVAFHRRFPDLFDLPEDVQDLISLTMSKVKFHFVNKFSSKDIPKNIKLLIKDNLDSFS
ncbi:MAG TPA: XRE family transcriptional regulator [bacterium]|nr:XRE family transcriptional regulator [bacterium]